MFEVDGIDLRHPPTHRPEQEEGSCHCSTTRRCNFMLSLSHRHFPCTPTADLSGTALAPTAQLHPTDKREKILCKFHMAKTKCSRNLGACCNIVSWELALKVIWEQPVALALKPFQCNSPLQAHFLHQCSPNSQVCNLNRLVWCNFDTQQHNGFQSTALQELH